MLKNQDVVAQAEKILKDFKPVTYDVSAQLKALDAFEAKAVSTLDISAAGLHRDDSMEIACQWSRKERERERTKGTGKTEAVQVGSSRVACYQRIQAKITWQPWWTFRATYGARVREGAGRNPALH